jgi:hypothetical protein
VLGVHNIAVAEQVLGQKDGRGDVAIGGEAKQIPAHRHAALGFGPIHHVAEACDRPAAPKLTARIDMWCREK